VQLSAGWCGGGFGEPQLGRIIIMECFTSFQGSKVVIVLRVAGYFSSSVVLTQQEVHVRGSLYSKLQKLKLGCRIQWRPFRLHLEIAMQLRLAVAPTGHELLVNVMISAMG